MNTRFEDFLTERNDAIDNASYALAVTLLRLNPSLADEEILPWDMEIIGSINESVQRILEEHGHPVCWPYHEDAIPCYQTTACEKTDCLLKGCLQKEDEQNETN